MTANSTPRRDATEQSRLDATLIDLFDHQIVFHKLLDLTVLSVRPGDVRCRLPMRRELISHDHYGRLHGGVIASVLDALGGLAMMVAIAERHPADATPQIMHRIAKVATIDMRIDFLHPGVGRAFEAHADVSRLGGRVGSTQMRMTNDAGRLIATAAASYVVS